MVGGTGLYIDAVLYNFTFRPKADPDVRRKLEAMSVEELQAEILQSGLELPNNAQNSRHLIRTLETGGEVSGRDKQYEPSLLLGLQLEREELRGRIAKRVEVMLANGFVDEVKRVSEKYGWAAQALQAPGYRAFRKYLGGDLSLDEAKAEFIKNDLNLAKRQRTWFRRNKSIHWVKEQAEAVAYTTTFLNKYPL
jgi:tRNA dimethylallyltransferase